MRFSEARHQEVISTSTATQVARVDGFVVLPRPGRVGALRLDKVAGDGDLLNWSDLTAFGRDAVTVSGAERIHSARDQAELAAASTARDVLGKPVLTERGAGRGTVTDIDFDLSTGEITAIITDREEIPGRLLTGVGTYAVIVALAN